MDAARNRAKVLAAAVELFATRDPRTVTTALSKLAHFAIGSTER
jgi:hypothetical protein